MPMKYHFATEEYNGLYAVVQYKNGKLDRILTIVALKTKAESYAQALNEAYQLGLMGA
jgi:hypothetical protein